MSLRALRRLQATGGQASSLAVPGSREFKEKKKSEEKYGDGDDGNDDVELGEEGEEEEAAAPAIVPAKNVFDLLDDENGDEDEDDGTRFACVCTRYQRQSSLWALVNGFP